MDASDRLFEQVLKLAERKKEEVLGLAYALRELKERHPDRYQAALDASNLSRRKAYHLIAISKQFKGFSPAKRNQRRGVDEARSHRPPSQTA